MGKACQSCTRCCRYFCFEIDEPDTFEEFEDIKWFLCHEGISVHIDEGDWFISIDNKCKMLRADNTCSIYENRPIICRKYPPDNCDLSDGDYQYEAMFEKPEDIEAYARKALGAKYEKAQAKALRKLAAGQDDD